MMNKIVLCIAAIVTVAPMVVRAQYDRPGSTDGQFLKIGVSPRAAAMGDAYIAVANGAEATYYNSAALPWIKGTDIVFNHTRWFAGIHHEFAAATLNLDAFGSFGISFTALYTDEMQVTTPLQPDGTGETFYVGNYRLGVTYARFLTDRVTLGVSLNYIAMSLYAGFSAEAVAVDIGTMYVSDFRGFRFSMQISNFGSSIQYVNEAYPLPTNFTFGLGMNALESDNQTLLFSFSAVKPNEGKPIGQVGMEWNYDNMLFLRGGYHLNHAVRNHSFGGGVKFGLSEYEFRFDYSYSNFLLLGAAHRIGVGVRL
jgi:hypothetical protein